MYYFFCLLFFDLLHFVGLSLACCIGGFVNLVVAGRGGSSKSDLVAGSACSGPSTPRINAYLRVSQFPQCHEPLTLISSGQC